MHLKVYLESITKAQLQGCYVHWHPGKEVVSVRERLTAELLEAMTDAAKVRQRFDGLTKAQQAFVVGLLVRGGFSGTVSEVRAGGHGRSIEDYEVESLLKSLQESGYVIRTSGTGGYENEVFCMPQELGDALRRTVQVEERQPLEMLSLKARGAELNGRSGSAQGAPDELSRLESATHRLDSIQDEELVKLGKSALWEHGGILTHSSLRSEPGALNGQHEVPRIHRAEWRRELEAKDIGTTGILNLKDYGIELEEEGLILYQELVHEACLAAAVDPNAEVDREICAGADLIIDLDKSLELLRREALEVTREGNVYKKIEEKIAGQFATASYPELHDGSAVSHIIELGRRLQFFDAEDQRMVVDPLRRWVWRKKPFAEKVAQIFELYKNEKRGQRWSFHQTAIREIFLDLLQSTAPGSWLVARPFLTAVIAKYLTSLDERKVRQEFTQRCTVDFKNETLVVPLAKLHHDLSYWVVHRLALLGVIDAGYREGTFHALRLSQVGKTLFSSPPQAGAPEAGSESPRVLVNPDFEILVYPEADEEASWRISLFAERLGSDRVKRYKLSRESLKRGIFAGLAREEILEFLERIAHRSLPPNVHFSIKEWTEGVEIVRLQKVRLLRAQTRSGADRIAEVLDANEVAHERLTETIVMVRGGKNERALMGLIEHFRENGLFVE